MTEFQGNLLLAQMTRLEEQSRTREQNAQYLTSMLKEIPGILPAKMYEGCTRNAYHLYMFRYKSEAFGGLPRAKFLQALEAEGIPCSAGYSPLNKESFLQTALQFQGIPADLSQGAPRPLGRAEPLPGQRPALPGGRLVHPDHVPGHAQRHGPDRRGRAEDPGPRGGDLTRAGVSRRRVLAQRRTTSAAGDQHPAAECSGSWIRSRSRLDLREARYLADAARAIRRSLTDSPD